MFRQLGKGKCKCQDEVQSNGLIHSNDTNVLAALVISMLFKNKYYSIQYLSLAKPVSSY